MLALKKILSAIAGLLINLPMIALAANPEDMQKLIHLKEQPNHFLDLSNVDLRHYKIKEDKIDLQGANLSHSNLAGVDLSKMNLGGANLSYADLSNTKLDQVNLVAANLAHANLTGAELQQSDLSKSNLSFSNLQDAKLQHSILAGTNLQCANLDHADLSQSDFANANISGASLVNTITDDIRGYDSVIENQISCNG